MTFTESNTVEQIILNALPSRSGGRGDALAVREELAGWVGLLGGGPGWQGNLMHGGMS